jgi:V/A-type H+-transporting ATPase subunit I
MPAALNFLRPREARWFEVLVARNDAAAALEVLATTGAAQIELHPRQHVATPAAELKPLLDRYTELSQQFLPYWPVPASGIASAELSAVDTLTHALESLVRWRGKAETVIRSLQALEQERVELDIWQELFTRYRTSLIDFGLLRRNDGVLARRLYVFPADVYFPVPESMLHQRMLLQNQACVLVLGPQQAVAELDKQAAALKGRRSGLGMPPWLEGSADENLPRVLARRDEVEAGAARQRVLLEKCHREHDLARALGEIERLKWFAQQVQVLPYTEYFAWLTGWTSDVRGNALESALKHAKLRALVRFAAPPPGAVAPLILDNPWWAQPFELFARAIGMPSRSEVDPSPLLALVAPLLFGYMFGDVGQGALLLAAGLALRRRLAGAGLLIAGGAAAIVFGFLFGSVFSREDLLDAIWLHPLREPLLLLGVPLAFGALLLILGQVLAAVEAYWRGEFIAWLQGEAGMLCAYLGAACGLFDAAFFWLAGAGIVWYIAGHAVKENNLLAVFSGLGSALELGFQLAVNTLSFARVGAFALAHAGLSSAIVTLADASANTAVAGLIMLAGNAVVIALEGLVVSIQTTRLVLFEFFIRFLRGEGKAFHSLSVPHPHH